ncbi:MAG: serine/threonine-protein kinase, partial [Verrucomicrobiota bacterium]
MGTTLQFSEPRPETADTENSAPESPYDFIELLGEGGFGEVWRAEQLSPVRRSVAIKFLKRGDGKDEAAARFQAEQQALALMNHPNIAKVYDAGVLENGGLFFAMELVGQSDEDGNFVGAPNLIDYCVKNRLKIRPILQLFRDVCKAITHAHQRGVIHRDLKPSNILVGQEDGVPVPKIIDFGIAKDSGAGLLDESLHTMTGQIMGTPQYMSPEQASGDPSAIDTRTDVYALGVILYQLLVGTPPIDKNRLKDIGLVKILEVIRHEEFPRPSDAITKTQSTSHTASSSSLIRGELDWITLKALEKDPVFRYQTAGELVEDLEAYLDHRELRYAASPSSAYRLKKFFRRNRGLVLAVSAIAISLIAGTIFSLWQAVEASQAQSRAEANFNAAENYRETAERLVFETVFGLKNSLRESGQIGILEGAISSSEAYLESLPPQQLKDLETQRQAVMILWAKAELRIEQNRRSEAIELLEDALEKNQLLAQEVPKQLVNSVNLMAELAKLYEQTNHPENAIKWTDEAYALADQLYQQAPENPHRQLLLKTQLSNQAWYTWQKNDYHQALSLYESSQSLGDKALLLETFGAVPVELNISAADLHIGQIYTELQRWDEAEYHFRNAVSNLESLQAQHPDNPKVDQQLSGARSKLNQLSNRALHANSPAHLKQLKS